MRRETAFRTITAIVAVGLCATACGFRAPVDNGPDGAPAATVGFAQAASLADESSGTIMVPVVLSEPASQQITVSYAINDGSAIRDEDYTGTNGTLIFAPGETEAAIELAILTDAMDEPDETIALALESVTGAVLGTASHTVTISANVLPRVTLSVDTSSDDEDTTRMITFQLDEMSDATISVDYSLGGTASPQDHGLVAGTVMFAPGSVMEQRALGVVDDDLDEDPETVVVTLTNPDQVIIGTIGEQTHTIVDDDATPTVSFAMAGSTISEPTATVNLMVSLSAVSGRTVTVPFAIDAASSAAATADYTVMTASPLVFPEGTMTRAITVEIVNDNNDELDETIVIDLGAATNADPGANMTHTVTIEDDELTCYGAGTYEVCLPTPPASAVTLPATIDTDAGSANCAANQPLGWQSPQGQPAACFVIGTSITMNQNTRVTGDRPLVLVASNTIAISQTLDVASHRAGTVGPGSPSGACKPFPQDPPQADTSGADGGAGGSFMTAGGDGGRGNGRSSGGSTAPTADATPPAVLRAGCDGQIGGDAGGENPGAIGRGGGAVYLVAMNGITITGAINASGSAGSGGTDFTGGSAAGSGGMIVLHAPVVTATGGILMANGGGGASGGDNNAAGGNGSDPSTTTPTIQAGGSPQGSGGAPGGNGYAGAPPGSPASGGDDGGSNQGGGGGGGGGGYIQANVALTGAILSAGRIDDP